MLESHVTRHGVDEDEVDCGASNEELVIDANAET